MKFCILLLISTLIGCTSLIDEPIFSINEEILPHYYEFIHQGELRGVHVGDRDIIYYLSPELNVIGRFIPRNDGVIEIVLNSTIWDNNENIQLRELIVFHEMGHAFLGKSHNDDCFSIMNESNLCEIKEYEETRLSILNELFGADPIN